MNFMKRPPSPKELRPHTIVSNRTQNAWDKTKLMPKSLMNRKFLDISAVVKIDDEGKIDYSQARQSLNITENKDREQLKLGRINMLKTPSSQYRSIFGTTDVTTNNMAAKVSRMPSTPANFELRSIHNEMSTEYPMLPEIKSRATSSEPQSFTSKKSINLIKAKRSKKRRNVSNYGSVNMDLSKEGSDYEPLNLIQTAKQIKYTNVINSMREKGRFPIPDAIKLTQRHPRNDENVMIRMDSLIESAYDSERGDEWVKNEDFIIPGILSPLHSEVSMHEVDLYSSTDDEKQAEDTLRLTTQGGFSTHKRGRLESNVSAFTRRPSEISRKNSEVSPKNSETTRKQSEVDKNQLDASQKQIPGDESSKLVPEDRPANSPESMSPMKELEDSPSKGMNEDLKEDTVLDTTLVEEKSISPAPGLEKSNTEDNSKVFGSQKINSEIAMKFLNFKNMDAAQVEILFQNYCHDLGVTPIKINSYLVQGKNLMLSRYKLNFGLAKALAYVLPFFNKLEKVVLSDNTLEDNGLAVIMEALQHCPNFMSLKVMRNRPRKLFMENLYNCIHNRSRMLKVINLRG